VFRKKIKDEEKAIENVLRLYRASAIARSCAMAASSALKQASQPFAPTVDKVRRAKVRYQNQTSRRRHIA
jgi:hypothetical protein